MCGIAGVYLREAEAPGLYLESVEDMLRSLQHRGPDDQGLMEDSSVVLGHRRLSILDLSTAGHQPMSNEDSSIWITFNGEIYNYIELRQTLRAKHRFRSDTDTEVIIHGYEEWGPEGLLKRLRGMFAFALYDKTNPSEPVIFLARDRMGIKPLYYTSTEQEVAFASEVQALCAGGFASNNPDPDGIIGFLALGSTPCPRTSVRGVKSLPPGHYLAVSRREVSLIRYWDICYSDNGSPAILENRLREAVRIHLRSDVPLGVFLSGGMDSSGLVQLASMSLERSLITLNISFKEEQFNESATARSVAEHFHTEHHEVTISSDDFMNELPRFFDSIDEPTNDGVNTYFVSRAARNCGLTVVMSGLGGDEFFLGYRHQRWVLSHRSWLALCSKLPQSARKTAASVIAVGGRFTRDRWKRFDYFESRPFFEALYLVIRGFFAAEDIARLSGTTRAHVDCVLDEIFTSLGETYCQHGDRLLHYYELKRYLHDQLLRDSDVFGMAHSLELRVPYLDHHVVETCCTITPDSMLDPKINKPLLAAILRDPLINRIARTPKRGFTFPFSEWMKVHAAALEEIATEGCFLDRKNIVECWSRFCQGRAHWSRAWATAVLNARFKRRFQRAQIPCLA